MMKSLYNICIATATVAVLSSCSGTDEKENMMLANDVTAVNLAGDSLVVSINDEVVNTTKRKGTSVYLTSGEYQLKVENTNTHNVVNVPVKMNKVTDDNRYDIHIIRTDKNVGYVTIDIRALYYSTEKLAVAGRYFDQDYIEIPMKTEKFYWPWSKLPEKVTSFEGRTALMYRLCEVPASYKDKSDLEILAYCADLIE